MPLPTPSAERLPVKRVRPTTLPELDLGQAPPPIATAEEVAAMMAAFTRSMA
jgi:hypothetical protein